jgi:hypothetical protein
LQGCGVRAQGRIKISDMGFSKRLDNGQSSFDTVQVCGVRMEETT